MENDALASDYLRMTKCRLRTIEYDWLLQKNCIDYKFNL